MRMMNANALKMCLQRAQKAKDPHGRSNAEMSRVKSEVSELQKQLDEQKRANEALQKQIEKHKEHKQEMKKCDETKNQLNEQRRLNGELQKQIVVLKEKRCQEMRKKDDHKQTLQHTINDLRKKQIHELENVEEFQSEQPVGTLKRQSEQDRIRVRVVTNK